MMEAHHQLLSRGLSLQAGPLSIYLTPLTSAPFC